MIERIYGIDYLLPKEPRADQIDNRGLEPKKQKFYRKPLPKIFDNLEFDEEDEPVYTDDQTEYINQELDRIEYGYWFYNYNYLLDRSVATYITGLHYFYVQYWILEDGGAPEYRDADRRWFYFQDYCQRQPHIDGIIRSKKRREGATSQATASLVRTAIMGKDRFCGIVSKGNDDAESAFLNMVRKGFLKLPVFLQPRVEDAESKTELSFNRPKKRGRKEKKRGQVYEESMGLGSRVDFRPTKLNSYDSGRLTEVLVDEGGKFPTACPINEYWPIVQQTLKQGARKVGFALLPSTSNKLKAGGVGFKLLWDESNHFKGKMTATGLYRYFNPADDGYAPYIDEYGMSIRTVPNREQSKWMKKHYAATDDQCTMSARDWILLQRKLKTDEMAKREQIRMFPLEEKEAFDYEDRMAIYNQENLEAQQERIMDVKPAIRRGIFVPGEVPGKPGWRDEENGMWHVLKFPEDHERHAATEKAGKPAPANTWKYVLTADPFKNTITAGEGSKGAGMVWQKLDPMDPENSGMPIAFFFGRPKLTRHFHEQMLYAAQYFGCDMLYESDYDSYLEFLMERGMLNYAKEKPKNAIDPNKKTKEDPEKRMYGLKSGDGFQYALMLDRSIAYVETYCHKIWFLEVINQLYKYDEDPKERTKYDAAVAFQLGCVAISDPVRAPQKTEKRTQPKLQTYRLKLNKW
jgi:hypothetical protein